MSFGSGFIIGQMLGNSNSSYQKHALEKENYELKRNNDELVQKMHILEQQLQEAQILAMNCMSSLAEKGCGHFELCESCLKRGYCIDYFAKKFLDKYFEKEFK